ncbi:hypothetical protein Hs30E_13810 [Lactococcus hodotermopsidis]|uniref:Gram-positive cocci surface proteins LPxTG domain-containing protein n=1 Tax=Pseudolactococcus hodotermopsidis TaxID=2709157 RepID=A0A6A0BBR4_9LACT|nr:pectate lyase-like adhesive domain-containing protein [Lactococcus hodotermopsidis]GFH42830.1 hypothetical protein Hs30E_13810 [Lactococcus hodotermopsidis]
MKTFIVDKLASGKHDKDDKISQGKHEQMKGCKLSRRDKEVKHTHFRMWKSGKRWLYASSVLTAITSAIIGHDVFVSTADETDNVSRVKKQRDESDGITTESAATPLVLPSSGLIGTPAIATNSTLTVANATDSLRQAFDKEIDYNDRHPAKSSTSVTVPLPDQIEHLEDYEKQARKLLDGNGGYAYKEVSNFTQFKAAYDNQNVRYIKIMGDFNELSADWNALNNRTKDIIIDGQNHKVNFGGVALRLGDIGNNQINFTITDIDVTSYIPSLGDRSLILNSDDGSNWQININNLTANQSIAEENDDSHQMNRLVRNMGPNARTTFSGTVSAQTMQEYAWVSNISIVNGAKLKSNRPSNGESDAMFYNWNATGKTSNGRTDVMIGDGASISAENIYRNNSYGLFYSQYDDLKAGDNVTWYQNGFNNLFQSSGKAGKVFEFGVNTKVTALNLTANQSARLQNRFNITFAAGTELDVRQIFPGWVFYIDENSSLKFTSPKALHIANYDNSNSNKGNPLNTYTIINGNGEFIMDNSSISTWNNANAYYPSADATKPSLTPPDATAKFSKMSISRNNANIIKTGSDGNTGTINATDASGMRELQTNAIPNGTIKLNYVDYTGKIKSTITVDVNALDEFGNEKYYIGQEIYAKVSQYVRDNMPAGYKWALGEQVCPYATQSKGDPTTSVDNGDRWGQLERMIVPMQGVTYEYNAYIYGNDAQVQYEYVDSQGVVIDTSNVTTAGKEAIGKYIPANVGNVIDWLDNYYILTTIPNGYRVDTSKLPARLEVKAADNPITQFSVLPLKQTVKLKAHTKDNAITTVEVPISGVTGQKITYRELFEAAKFTGLDAYTLSQEEGDKLFTFDDSDNLNRTTGQEKAADIAPQSLQIELDENRQEATFTFIDATTGSLQDGAGNDFPVIRTDGLAGTIIEESIAKNEDKITNLINYYEDMGYLIKSLRNVVTGETFATKEALAAVRFDKETAELQSFEIALVHDTTRVIDTYNITYKVYHLYDYRPEKNFYTVENAVVTRTWYKDFTTNTEIPSATMAEGWFKYGLNGIFHDDQELAHHPRRAHYELVSADTPGVTVDSETGMVRMVTVYAKNEQGWLPETGAADNTVALATEPKPSTENGTANVSKDAVINYHRDVDSLHESDEVSDSEEDSDSHVDSCSEDFSDSEVDSGSDEYSDSEADSDSVDSSDSEVDSDSVESSDSEVDSVSAEYSDSEADSDSEEHSDSEVDSGSDEYSDSEGDSVSEESSDSEADSGSNEHSDSEVDSASEEHSDSEVDSGSAEHSDSEVDSSSAEHSDSEADSNSEEHSDSEADSDSEEDSDSVEFSDSEIDSVSDESSDSEADSESDESSDSEADSDSEEHSDSEVDSGSEELSDSEVDSDSTESSDSEVDSTSVEHSDSEVDSDSAESSDSEADSGSAEHSDSEVDSDSAESSDSEADSGSEEHSDSEADSDSAETSDSEVDSVSAENSDSEADSGSEEHSDSEVDSDSEEDSDSEADSDSEEHRDSEADSGSEEHSDSEVDSDSAESRDSEADSGSEEGSDSEVDSVSAESSDSEADSGSEESSDSEADSGSEELSDSEVDSGSEEDSDSEVDLVSAENSDSEADSGSEESSDSEADSDSAETSDSEVDSVSAESSDSEADSGSEEYSDSEADSGSEESSDSEADSDSAEISDSEVDSVSAENSDSEADSGSEEHSDSEADSGSEESSDSEADSDSAETSDSEVDSVSAENSDSEADSGSEEHSDSEVDSASAESSDSETDSGSEESSDSEADSGSEEHSDSEADSGSEEHSDSGVDSDSAESSDSEVDSGSEESSDSEADSESAESSDSEADSASNEHSDSEADSASAESSDSEVDSDSAESSDSEADSGSEELSDSEADSGSEEHSDSEVDSDSAESSDSEADSGSEEGSDSEVDSVSAESSDSEADSISAESSDSEADSGSAESSDSEADSGSAESSDSEADSGSNEHSDSEVDSDSAESSDSEADSDSEEHSDSEVDSASAERSDSEADSGSAESSDSEADSGSEESSDSEADSGSEEDSDSEVDLVSAERSDSEADSDSEESSDSEVDSDSAESSDSEADSDSAESSDSEVDSASAESSDSEVDSGSAESSDSEADSGSAELSDSEADSASAESSDSEADSGSEEHSDSEADSDSEESSDSEVDSDSAESSDSEADSGSEEHSDSEVDSDSAESSDSETDSGSEESSDSEADSGSEEHSDSEVDSASAESSDSEADSVSEEHSDSEADSDSEEDSDSEADSGSNEHSDSEADSGSEEHSDSEVDSDSAESSDSEADSGSAEHSDSGVDSSSAESSDSEADSGSEEHSDSEVDSESEADSDSEEHSDSEYDWYTSLESDSETNEPDPIPNNDTLPTTTSADFETLMRTLPALGALFISVGGTAMFRRRRNALVTISEDGYVKRFMTSENASSIRTQKGIIFAEKAHTSDKILIFTTRGNVIYRPISDIKNIYVGDILKGQHISEMTMDIAADEKVLFTKIVDKCDKSHETILIVTQNGFTKKIAISDLVPDENYQHASRKYIDLSADDEIIYIDKATSRIVIFATDKMKIVYAITSAIPIEPLSSSGNRISALMTDDKLVHYFSN